MERASDVSGWLRGFLARHGGIAGTVHVHREEGMLELFAAHNIPEPVQKVTARVPIGKGMAGLALEQGKPITTCNLQTDTSGSVKPGATAVNAQAAAALPVRDATGRVRAIVGIAFLGERELSNDDLAALNQAAAELPG
jgi:L-methionine (R)-S-oxide reductase